MSGIGQRAKFSFPYVGDRPREVLKLTEAQEGALSQFIGFAGTDPEDQPVEQFILVYNGTTVPTLTDYASTPIGTIILTPKLANVFCYQHQAQSSPAVVGDWASVAKTTVT
jgi:hypothetical protein